MHEQVLRLYVVQVNRQVVRAVRGPVLQYGYDVRNLVLGEELGFDCRCQTFGGAL